ncbi:fatty acyl-CoA reductase 1-like [Cydia splendana]|uniref:fatty acyl-CoA reductase 1-like n=1 Tax=Cydia splendana TaxID=1100963 RepID=UPI00300D3F48
MEDTLNDPLFEKVRTMRGGIEPLLEKMTLIAGDAIEPDLGLSPADRQKIIEEADIIIHGAATVRFDVELRRAVLLNVRGTKLVLELGKQCKRLLLFIHISTAYCHPHEKLLEEKPYSPPANPHKIIQIMEWMDDATAAAVTPFLLKKQPNSYAFTKALGEALVVEALDIMPIGILRPSIVIPIYQEPLPGWTDNINGPTGLLIGAGKGVIRTMYCKSNSYADYLPVDVFINGIMIWCWVFIEQGVHHIKVIHLTSSAEVKVTWEEMIEAGREIILNRVPLNGVAWYPGGSMKHSRLYHNICVLLFHWLPAILVDCLLWCLRYEPVLCRVQRRVTKGFEVFEFYTNNQWDFHSDIGQQYRNDLNPRERLEYKVDASVRRRTTCGWRGRCGRPTPAARTFPATRTSSYPVVPPAPSPPPARRPIASSRPHLPRHPHVVLPRRAARTFPATRLDIKRYFEDCILAARRYILKETDDTIPAAKRHMKVMWWVDMLFRICFWALLLYWISGFSSTPTAVPEAISA